MCLSKSRLACPLRATSAGLKGHNIQSKASSISFFILLLFIYSAKSLLLRMILFRIFTSKNISCLFFLCVFQTFSPFRLDEKGLTLMAALLQYTRVTASQVGRSSMFCRTSSSSSRLESWPSPFRVLRLILSGERFLVNLKEPVLN